MKIRRNGILVLLFSLTAVVLFAPLLQQNLRLFKFKGLIGYYEPTKKPILTYETYSSGAYQRRAEKYLKENFGFREPLIRMYNQYLYDFYKTTSNKDVSIEKDGWLYHSESIAHYFGNMESVFGLSNSQVRENLTIQARCLNKVDAILKEYDVHLLTFTLPTKSFIYPEHLRRHPVGDTTFNAPFFFEQQLASYGVPHINMIPWFKQMQDTCSIELYYSKGSHWAAGAPLAVDTMLRYMEHISGQSLTHIQLGQPYTIANIPHDDQDLENLLNLASPIKHEAIYEYPVTLSTDENTAFPTVWFVGTSFYWYLTRRVNFDVLFSSRDFLFYHALFYSDKEQVSISADKMDLLRQLLLHDYVVFFRDGPQLYNKGFLFPAQSLLSLCISDERLKEKKLAIADSLRQAWNAQTPNDSIICYKQAQHLIQKNPEAMFEELRGDGIPTCRNPKIEQILIERSIRADRTWSFLLNAKVKNDSIDSWKTFSKEAYNVLKNRYLLRDNTYFTTYDYFDFLVEEAMDDIRRHAGLLKTEDEIAELALGEIEKRVQQHAYDDDTLMMTACTMDAIVKQIGREAVLQSIRDKAAEKHISIDKAFRDNAVWCLNNIKDRKHYLNEATLTKAFEAYRTERKIRSNQGAMTNVMEKHQKQDLPLRLIINRDIEWIHNHHIQ